MERRTHRAARWLGQVAMLVAALGLTTFARADQAKQANSLNQDELWRRSVELVGKGEFESAAATIRKITGGGVLTERVRGWLESYEAQQERRRELDRKDFELYRRYAKERIERKEYARALDQTLKALDVASDRDAFLQTDWVLELVNASLEKAKQYRKDREWQDAWHIYTDLSALYEREPRYQKLEREMLTLLRLEHMFDKDTDWERRLEKVRWEDAEEALDYIDMHYVVPTDFKDIAEAGLEHLLLLAESHAAQKEFEGLGNEVARNDFENRIKSRLDRIRQAPTLTRSDCIKHFRRVVLQINKQTVQLPRQLIVSELMRGAFEPLDDFTTIIWPQDAEEFDKHTRGDFIGVGISIVANRATDEIEVVTPLEDTPAFRAGIQAGDIIESVDGERIKGYSINKVVDIITGPKDTWVTLTIRRDGKLIDFPLKRAKVNIQSVKGLNRDEYERWNHWLDKENGIGYIRLTNFQRNTHEDLVNVLSALEAGGLRGLVLDLRGNPGGLLDSAWRVSSLFLDDHETVVTTKGRIRSDNQALDAARDGEWSDLPMVVLVDESSASASEIVAGAIRDNHHGLVVGARTFGKFSVQNLIRLSRSNAKLKITTARYYLPSGASLHREPTSDTWGVEPDIPVRLARKERINIWKMRRDADRIGPAKPEEEDDDELADVDAADEKKADQSEDEGESGKVADAEPEKEDELPPLEQPDENDRPKVDPQLDTALLVMRVNLVAKSNPTLADANTPETTESASP